MKDFILTKDLAIMCGIHPSNVMHLVRRGIISQPSGILHKVRNRYWTPTAAAANVVAVERYKETRKLRQVTPEARAMYDANLPLIYKAARRWVPMGIDLDDWQQECALAVLKNLHSFDASKGAYSTWIYRVCWSIAVEAVRYEHIRRTIVAASLSTKNRDGEGYDIEVEDYRQPDPAGPASHLVEDVRQGLRSLPARAQEVVMARMDNEPERAIGRRIGITRQRVDQIWRRSKQKLVNVMQAMGYDEGKG